MDLKWNYKNIYYKWQDIHAEPYDMMVITAVHNRAHHIHLSNILLQKFRAGLVLTTNFQVQIASFNTSNKKIGRKWRWNINAQREYAYLINKSLL